MEWTSTDVDHYSIVFRNILFDVKEIRSMFRWGVIEKAAL